VLGFVFSCLLGRHAQFRARTRLRLHSLGGLLRRLICLRLHSRLLRLQAGVRAQLSDQLRPLTGGRHARLLRLLRRGLLLLWLIRRLQASGAQMIIIMVVPR